MTLAEFRRDRGISQRELARVLGVSQSTVSRLEPRGIDELRGKHLRRLARKYGGTVLELVAA